MSLFKKNTDQPHLLHPRHWPTWMGLGALRLMVQLPWTLQMRIGKWMGLLMYYTLKERRSICCINLELAFPELSNKERQQLNRRHFISLGQGLLETAMSWWGHEKKLETITHIDGIEHLHEALKSGGVVLLSAHFTSLELGGRMLAPHLPLHVVYRPHQNPVIEQLVAKLRAKRYGKAISRTRIRTMLQSLQKGHAVWYAQDQHFKQKNSLMIPFFGIEASTNTATSRIASIGTSKVIPFFTVRNSNGYLLRFLPELDNFPGESVADDTLRINQLIEQQVREFPDQYLWTHRRFKTAPDNSDRYKTHKDNFPDSCC